MRQKSYEIIVLKPTAVFLSFLASQLPEVKLPDLRLLHIDNTAYTIPKQASEDALLNEIEKRFPEMFRHEISRWLGDSVRSEIETNFLDFLCCFRFELHNHIILMEHALEEGKQLLLFKPRLALLNWLKSTAEGNSELVEVIERVHLSNLEENATVMVKNFANLTEIKPFIKSHYQPIFSTAMTRISNQSEQWPSIDSFHQFNEYFAVEIHTQLIHLYQ
ncbi:hypothetical protein ACD661_00530 [Legionella lytica]|uniref:Uncharacterized protein n=1 Tax=Legionella lytica TaxID=96232 RepID=A0ABW8D2W3_9GAMM